MSALDGGDGMKTNDQNVVLWLWINICIWTLCIILLFYMIEEYYCLYCAAICVLKGWW